MLDASSIYRLKVEAFAETSLRYTVYQTPRSIRYLKWLLVQKPNRSRNHFFVLTKEGKTVGYYHAVSRNDDWFLNYIAVANETQGQGGGSLLLKHFEDYGCMLQSGSLSLDVMAEDAAVVQWYQEHGYSKRSEHFLIRLDMTQNVGSSSPKLCYSYREFLWARVAEELKGFSKLNCMCSHNSLVVGMIGNHICKLMKCEGLDVNQAILSIMNTFSGTRRVLIADTPNEVYHLSVPVLSKDCVWRFSKQIESICR
jgi:ribosomal protein S18 acetylase RimI-like enzyme